MQGKLTKWEREFAALEPVLNFADRLDAKNTVLAQTLAERERKIGALTKRLTSGIDADDSAPSNAIVFIGSQKYPEVFSDESILLRPFALTGEFLTLDFEIAPRVESYSRIRLDPSDCACVIEIQSMELHAANGDAFWKAESPANCFGSLNEQLLVLMGKNLLAWVVCFGDDPNFELTLPRQTLDYLSENGGTLKLTMRGSRIRDTAILEVNDFRIFLRNDYWAPQWGKKLSKNLDENTAQIHSALKAAQLLAESLNEQLKVSHDDNLLLSQRIADREQFFADQLRIEQGHAMSLQAAFVAREQDLSAQRKFEHEAALELTESLSKQLQKYNDESVHLQKELTRRTEDFESQIMAEQRNVAELQTALVTREREYNVQQAANHQEALLRAHLLSSQLEAVRNELLLSAKQLADQEKEAANQVQLSQRENQQALSSQLEAVRNQLLLSAKQLAVQEKEAANQIQLSQRETQQVLSSQLQAVRNEMLLSVKQRAVQEEEARVQLQLSQREAQQVALKLAEREREFAEILQTMQAGLTALRLSMSCSEREFESELFELRTACYRLQNGLLTAENGLAKSATELAAFKGSVFWRVSAPMRWFFRIQL